ARARATGAIRAVSSTTEVSTMAVASTTVANTMVMTTTVSTAIMGEAITATTTVAATGVIATTTGRTTGTPSAASPLVQRGTARNGSLLNLDGQVVEDEYRARRTPVRNQSRFLDCHEAGKGPSC